MCVWREVELADDKKCHMLDIRQKIGTKGRKDSQLEGFVRACTATAAGSWFE